MGMLRLRKRNKCARVWTISFPDRVVGIALQVHRTGFPMATTLATSHDTVERVAVGRVEIETQHGHPAVEVARRTRQVSFASKSFCVLWAKSRRKLFIRALT